MKSHTPSALSGSGRIRIADPLSLLSDLSGRTAVVTGAARGIGLATARALANRGADVLLGVRDTERGEQTRQCMIEQDHLRGEQLTIAHVDLLDLDSVRLFATRAARRPLDILILNAGISSVPLRLSRKEWKPVRHQPSGTLRADGHLLAALARGTDPRIVTVSSAPYKGAVLDIDDLAGAHGYPPARAHSRSKPANTMFAVELRKRLAETGSPLRSFAAHPGMARTPLHTTYPSPATRLATRLAAGLVGRDPEPAAIAILTAAASTQVDPQLFWGPTGSRSHPDVLGVPFAAIATDRLAADRLWAASARLTGVEYLT